MGDISRVFNQKGDAKDGMYKAVIGREVKMACGFGTMELTSSRYTNI